MAILALALATALSLTGCTPKDSPPKAGTATPTAPAPAPAPATATGSAPTTPPPAPVYKPATANGPAQNVPVPVLPAKAKEFSKTGLEEFARYWYSTLGYAYETGNTDPMMAVTDAACSTCNGAQKTISNWYGKGGWIMGGQLVVHSATSTFHQASDGTYQAILLIHQQRVVSYNTDKSKDNDIPAMTPRADIVVASYTEGRWTALRAEHLTKE